MKHYTARDEYFFKAVDSQGVVYTTRSSREFKHAVLVVPKAEDSVFKRPNVGWHREERFAMHEAAFWADMGYPTERLRAFQITEAEWRATVPEALKIERIPSNVEQPGSYP